MLLVLLRDLGRLGIDFDQSSPILDGVHRQASGRMHGRAGANADKQTAMADCVHRFGNRRPVERVAKPVNIRSEVVTAGVLVDL